MSEKCTSCGGLGYHRHLTFFYGRYDPDRGLKSNDSYDSGYRDTSCIDCTGTGQIKKLSQNSVEFNWQPYQSNINFDCKQYDLNNNFNFNNDLNLNWYQNDDSIDVKTNSNQIDGHQNMFIEGWKKCNELFHNLWKYGADYLTNQKNND